MENLKKIITYKLKTSRICIQKSASVDRQLTEITFSAWWYPSEILHMKKDTNDEFGVGNIANSISVQIGVEI